MRWGLLLSAADAATQAKLSSPGYGLALLKIVLSLVVVCALAYLLLRLLRRYLALTAVRSGGCLRVVDRCPLSPRQNLWVVEAAGRFFLLASTDGSVTKLAELEPDSIPPPPAPPPTFRELLNRKRRKKE